MQSGVHSLPLDFSIPVMSLAMEDTTMESSRALDFNFAGLLPHPAGLILHADGSFTREPTAVPRQPPNPDARFGVATQDVTIDEHLNLWARIYFPAGEHQQSRLLPIVVYFHGGGFLLLGADSELFQKFCEGVCSKSGVIVVSVNYRLAPEHKLPAAYEDGFAALKWLKCVAKGENEAPWLSSHADFSKILLMGDSAGGNLANRVALRASKRESAADLEPLKIVGQILLQPFFGAEQRSASELQFGNVGLTNEICDVFWRVALPNGASRDHPFCNHAMALLQGDWDLGASNLPKTLLIVGGQDPLQDREFEFAEMLRSHGKHVDMVVYPNAGHAFYTVHDLQDTVNLMDKICTFCHFCCGLSSS